MGAVDNVLSEVKFYEREGIKTDIAAMNGNADMVDVEVELEGVLLRQHTCAHVALCDGLRHRNAQTDTA